MFAKFNDYLTNDPVKALALIAALIAIATTPIAFAILGRLNWFEARRGRVMMRPTFASIIVGMLLVMGVPAIFGALVIKSQDFDKNRYEFDPNKIPTTVEQGRQYSKVADLEKAERDERDRLAMSRKDLVNAVKKLDDAMLALRAASSQSPAVAQTLPDVLQKLSAIRLAVGVDGPQQLIDNTAPPAALPAAPMVAGTAAAPAPAPVAVVAAPAAPPAGLAKAQADAELATVAALERPLAAMVPLVDIPAGWEVTKYGTRHFESFNAENMFEKIDGRAESFTQFNVTGMAYTSYHPIGDDSNEVQLYIFEFDHSKPLRAKSKYSSEKPETIAPIAIGTEGYTAAGSLLFFIDPYYTQIVSTVDEPKFANFAVGLAKRIALQQTPKAESTAEGEGEGESMPRAPGKPKANSPEAIYALLPAGPGREEPKFVAQDVFGYGFFSDVFMADYKDGKVGWQGYLRPYASPEEAKAVFEKYIASAKTDGGSPRPLEAEGADEMALNANIGLVDVIFRKGNVLGGVNGSTDPVKAEAFARSFAKSLPADLPKAAPAEK